MLSLILLVTGVALECLILFRGYRIKILSKYPFFYSYLSCVLLVDVSRDLVHYVLHPAWYRNLYWGTEFLSLLVGYGVILEVTRKSFEPYEGAERFARVAVLGVFSCVFAYVAYKSLTGQDWSPANSVGELERDLRAVQALVIASVVGLLYYYDIRIRRNLSGIILGYGLFTTTSVMSLALRSYAGTVFDAAWKAIGPYSYLVSLGVWAVALWSYQPNPAPDPALRLEADYESLVGRTRSMLGTMRSLLERYARP